MFVVVEHFLPNLDHLVAHVLDLRHSLHKDRQKKKTRHGQHPCAIYTDDFSPLDVETASPAAEDLHHHELARDKKPGKGGGRNVCTLHISHWVQVPGPQLILLVLVDANLNPPLAFIGLAADIKTPLHT